MVTKAVTRQRRKLSFSRKAIVAGALLLGLAFTLSATVNFVDRDGLTQITGAVRAVERKTYWEDVVLYMRVEGAEGRFKYESGNPGFAAFEAAVAAGTPVRLLVDTTSLELSHPAAIYEAEVAGELLIGFGETSQIHNQQVWIVMLLGPVFWFLGIWIWHMATRPLPTPEEAAAYQVRLEQLAERHWLLFLVVHVVTTIRQWGEQIPKVGDLFTAFLFFWILPLFMVFVYVTAQTFRRFVAAFCLSYWIALAVLSIAALTVPGFPGGEEYPALGATGSRLFHAYLLLNIAYGGSMWLWGTLMDEPDAEARAAA